MFWTHDIAPTTDFSWYPSRFFAEPAPNPILPVWSPTLCQLSYHCWCFVGSFQNCFLYVHMAFIFGNINSISTLFKVFACTEHFAMGKRLFSIRIFRVSLTITVIVSALLPFTESWANTSNIWNVTPVRQIERSLELQMLVKFFFITSLYVWKNKIDLYFQTSKLMNF